MSGFQEFSRLLRAVHQIPGLDVLLGYTDAHGDLLPLTNDDSLHRALASGPPPLRLLVQKRGKDGGQGRLSRAGQLCKGQSTGRALRLHSLCSPCPWPDLQATDTGYRAPDPRPGPVGRVVPDLSTLLPPLQQKLMPVA